MKDLSALVAWSVPCLGLLASVLFGRRKSRHESGSIIIPAIGLSLLLGIALTLLQVFLHGLCIKPLHLCVSRGDGNMSYWFQSFFAMPVYWLGSVVAWKVTK
jgi:hypothetical protein